MPGFLAGLFLCPIRAQLCQSLTGFVFEAAQQDEDQIQKPADTEEAKGQQPDDAGADLADVEAVGPQIAQEQAQEECGPLTLVDIAAMDFVDIGIVVNHIDHRLLGCCIGLRCAAALAKLRIVFDLSAAISAIHKIPLSFVP